MIKEFLLNEDGVSSVEIVLILLVLVGLVVIFKKQIVKILKSIFSRINSQQNTV